MSGQGKILVAVTASFLALAILTVWLRCYTRIFLQPSFGLDDGLAIASLVFLTLASSFVIASVKQGRVGYNIEGLPPAVIELGFKYTYLFEVTYLAAAPLAKVSVCIFLLRFSINRTIRNLLYVIIAIVASFGFSVFLYAILQCLPPSEFWRQAVQDNMRLSHGTCVDPRITSNIDYAHAAILAAVDFTLAIIPLFIVWNMHVAKSTKAYIAFILALGSIACVATIGRIVNVKPGLNSKSLIIIWSLLEVNMSLIATSAATLRPLVRKLNAVWVFFSNIRESRQEIVPDNMPNINRADIESGLTEMSASRDSLT